MRKNKILLAGENGLFMDSLKVVLERETDFETPVRVGCGVEAIRMAREISPDLLVIDQQLPDINLLQVAREVRQTQKSPSFVLIVKEETQELLTILSEISKVGVVRSSSGVAELMTAMRAVACGEHYINPVTIAILRQPPYEEPRREDPLAGITHREKEVLYWLAKGCTNKEISSILILSERTVKNHVSHILKKLDIRDRTKAAALAWSEGLPTMSEEFFL